MYRCTDMMKMYRYEVVQICRCAQFGVKCMQLIESCGLIVSSGWILASTFQLWHLRVLLVLCLLFPLCIPTELHPYLRPKIGLLIRKWNFLLLPSISFLCSSVLLKVRLLSRSHKRPKVDSTHKVGEAANMSTNME